MAFFVEFLLIFDSESILQKKRKKILENKIVYYKDLVKKLMSDEQIQKDLEKDPELNFDEFEELRKAKPNKSREKDIRSLL